MYKITLSKQADKTLRRISRKTAKNIVLKIKELANSPYQMRNIKKLTDHPGYRLRTGDWRIVYTIHENELLIHVVKIKPRGEVYK